MSARAANSSFSFQLPSLSYVDVTWEEPELRAGAQTSLPLRQTGFAAWVKGRIAAFRIWHRSNVAASELGSMSDQELLDIGVSRSDLPRLFDPAFTEELRQRGAGA